METIVYSSAFQNIITLRETSYLQAAIVVLLRLLDLIARLTSERRHSELKSGFVMPASLAYENDSGSTRNNM